MKLIIFVFCMLLARSTALAPPYGQLKVEKQYIKNTAGQTVQLRGMALMDQNYYGSFWNNVTVQQLKCYWNANVIRAVIGPSSTCCGGWAQNPEKAFGYLSAVVEACIEYGLYVIIDWHDFSEDLGNATLFFANVSAQWGGNPNILYEIWNEPDPGYNWTTIKAYAETIIPIIRANDPDNIIIIGTPNYSQYVNDVIGDGVSDTNSVYALHYYAATHIFSTTSGLGNIAQIAINASIPIFISEYGTVNSSGAGVPNVNSTDAWWAFDDAHHLSYVNWAVYDGTDSAAAFLPGTVPSQFFNSSTWTPSGQLVNAKLVSLTNQNLSSYGC